MDKPAASALSGSWANCPKATTTNIFIRTSAISQALDIRRHWRAQLEKLPRFVQARIDNWNYLRRALRDARMYLISCCPRTPPVVRERFTWDNSAIALFVRGLVSCSVSTGCALLKSIARHLDGNKIGNRMLFGGNLLRQPVLVQLKKDAPTPSRGRRHDGRGQIMNEVLFIGTYPGLTGKCSIT